MKNLVFAALVVVASVVSSADTAQAATGGFVWHHGTPIYVGSGSTSNTHGTMVGKRGTRVMRNWYGSRRSGGFFRR